MLWGVGGRRGRPRGKRSGRASGGRPAALHVTDDTARHMRYASRAKREADVSLSHLAPWSTTMASSATRWVRWRTKVKAHVLALICPFTACCGSLWVAGGGLLERRRGRAADE